MFSPRVHNAADMEINFSHSIYMPRFLLIRPAGICVDVMRFIVREAAKKDVP